MINVMLLGVLMLLIFISAGSIMWKITQYKRAPFALSALDGTSVLYFIYFILALFFYGVLLFLTSAVDQLQIIENSFFQAVCEFVAPLLVNVVLVKILVGLEKLMHQKLNFENLNDFDIQRLEIYALFINMIIYVSMQELVMGGSCAVFILDIFKDDIVAGIKGNPSKFYKHIQNLCRISSCKDISYGICVLITWTIFLMMMLAKYIEKRYCALFVGCYISDIVLATIILYCLNFSIFKKKIENRKPKCLKVSYEI
ncbi:hypothetical protein [Butyrivibrio sp. AE3004]|uniref:hypothetical protein n=1 Tax=Butyrivibrio sp. AE3004 TaxID=1506994 RepID=UPI000493BEEC|nr:hypothetical protein [Butyrivibrio sp. AE3004]